VLPAAVRAAVFASLRCRLVASLLDAGRDELGYLVRPGGLTTFCL
jgi:hypothetical protein